MTVVFLNVSYESRWPGGFLAIDITRLVALERYMAALCDSFTDLGQD